MTLRTDDEIVETIEALRDMRGYPPSMREIARELGYAVGGGAIWYRLQSLAKQGRISFDPRISRSIRVVEQPK